MINRIVTGCLLTAILLVCSGCLELQMDALSANQRMISTEPLRDTETAQRKNSIGLEHLAKGETDKAITAFEMAIMADVEFGPAHNNLGKAYFKQKILYKAAWSFERARKLIPKNPEPLNNLGLVSERAGELDEAVEYYRQAVKLDPENTSCRANLARAMIVRGDHGNEVRSLLTQIIKEDNRPEWLLWARKQLRKIGD